MATFVKQFNTSELQVLATTSTSGAAAFTTDEAQNAEEVRVVNIGPSGAYVFSALTAALATAGNKNSTANAANGTKNTYVAAGEDVIIGKGTCGFIAAITDAAGTLGSSGATTLFLHAGRGA